VTSQPATLLIIGISTYSRDMWAISNGSLGKKMRMYIQRTVQMSKSDHKLPENAGNQVQVVGQNRRVHRTRMPSS
jgi:hypothetical protein